MPQHFRSQRSARGTGQCGPYAESKSSQPSCKTYMTLVYPVLGLDERSQDEELIQLPRHSSPHLAALVTLRTLTFRQGPHSALEPSRAPSVPPMSWEPAALPSHHPVPMADVGYPDPAMPLQSRNHQHDELGPAPPYPGGLPENSITENLEDNIATALMSGLKRKDSS